MPLRGLIGSGRENVPTTGVETGIEPGSPSYRMAASKSVKVSRRNGGLNLPVAWPAH